MNLVEKIDPKGYVVIKDKDGKILQANYNTIVNEGRRTLLAKMIATPLATMGATAIGINVEDTNYDFHAIALGKDTGETSINTVFETGTDAEYKEFIDEIGEVKNPFWYELPKKILDKDNGEENTVSEFSINFNPDINRYFITFTLRVVPGSQLSTDTIEKACSLAIIMKHKNYDATEKKFYNLDESGNIIYDESNKPTYVEKSDLDPYRVFSRFRFDNIPLTSDSEFIISYYVYF